MADDAARPDELALAGAEHLDPAYAAGYDRKAAFDSAADVALLQRHGLGRDATLVDLGAGTGSLALEAATACARVVAVDPSPAMLAVLRQRLHAAAVTNVECVRAGFLTYAHAGPPADAVVTRHALHHLPDLWKAVALARLAALLRPGGLLHLRDLALACTPAEAEAVLDAWIAGGSASPEQGWTRAERATHVREEHSTFTWLLEPMLERAGFRIEHAATNRSSVYAEYLCRRAYRP